MAKSDEIWGGKLSELVQAGLEKKYMRPFVIQQAGPFHRFEKPLVELYFNDLALNQIFSSNPDADATYRYGFMLRHLYSEKAKTYELWVGFNQQSKVLALNAFVRNIRNNHKSVGAFLHKWLSKNPKNSWMSFGCGDDEYIWDSKDKSSKISKLLSYHGDPEWETQDLERNMHGLVHGIGFDCERELVKYRGMTELELRRKSDEIAKQCLKIFFELNELYYHLWPQERRIQID